MLRQLPQKRGTARVGPLPIDHVGRDGNDEIAVRGRDVETTRPKVRMLQDALSVADRCDRDPEAGRFLDDLGGEAIDRCWSASNC
jgi:hypothetical protein